jgi:uncharacterized membrane protein YcaP (DUF421 family)
MYAQDMTQHLVSGDIGWVIVKALLLYTTALIGFRLGERRTLAEMAPFDFVAAVAVGAVVGRVPNSETTSYLAGLATLVAILVAHRVVVRLRYIPGMTRLVDGSPVVIVAEGVTQERALRRCGMTTGDLTSLLRQKGIGALDEVRFAIVEPRGQVSVIRRTDRSEPLPDLVREALAGSDDTQ